MFVQLKAENESKCRDLMSDCERFHKSVAVAQRSGSDSTIYPEQMQQKLDNLRDNVMDLETEMLRGIYCLR